MEHRTAHPNDPELNRHAASAGRATGGEGGVSAVALSRSERL